MTLLHEQVAFIRLEPLTPIHIGTGDTMDPLGYIMREEDGQPFLCPVDVQAWVEAQPDPEGLATMFATKSLPEIRAYLTREIAPHADIYGSAPARVISRKIYDDYKRELSLVDSPNQLRIDPALKNPLTGALFIPGSSVKGAIRTAVIDWLDKQWKVDFKAATNRDRWGYDDALKELLGGISENAFRNLKVGDFPAALGSSVITTAKEVRLKHNPDKPGTPKNPCEASLSRVMGYEGHAVYGKIAVGAHGGKERDTVLTVKSRDKRQSWSLTQLMDLCNAFYSKRYNDEHEKFYSKSHLAETAKILGTINSALAQPASDSMILRLGHYSHVESMTVTANQPLTRRVPKGDGFYPFGTTRTLADGLYPFGWARLTVVSAEEYAEACQQREKHDTVFLAERTHRRQAATAAHQEAARQKAERALAEQQQREAEAAHQEALAAMSPDERLISVVANENSSENQAVELYGKLDSLDKPLQSTAAHALKIFWTKADKWEKKKCTAKQWAKVQKIRDILGDM